MWRLPIEQHFFFQLLKNMMSNAFQTETFYLKPPYNFENSQNFPSEILNTTWPYILYPDERLVPSSKKPNRRLFLTKTSLNFYTIHFYMSLEEDTDIIFIGPFRSDSISIDEFIKTLDHSPFFKTKRSYFLSLYENLPPVPLLNIINTVSYLINTYMFLSEPVSPIYVDFTTINNGLFGTDTAKDSALSPEIIARIHEILHSFLKAITDGNPNLAQQEMKVFLSETMMLSQKDFLECKRNLHALNTTIQTSIIYTHIQQLDASRLYLTFVDKIERIQTRDSLIKTAYDMCYTYCMLFRNNTFPEYSKTISDVINYIYIHLSEPLSLSAIAEHFGKNASRLSSDFKQETGQTLTNYIQQTRMTHAASYLHSTTLSISDVALATGFDDFAYFSRVFKKHTGYSPKEYRDMHINDNILTNKKGL